MFNSTPTNEEQPDMFHIKIISINFSLMIMEVSEYKFINLLIVAGVKFPLLVTGVVSKYSVLRVINVYLDRKKNTVSKLS